MQEPKLNYNKLVFFDTETVSINPNYIISLAYIAFEGGKRVDKDLILCNPDYPISPEASKVNGFTDEKVANYPLFPQQWAKIKKYFENAILIGHNCSFDVRALRAEFQRYNIQEPVFYTCDTYTNARRLIPKTEVENYKLGTLCDYFNITLDNWHSADADTLAALKLYNKLVKLSDGVLDVKYEG